MSNSEINILPEGAVRADRKPRIALLGEFSAGKSTLMNLLLGCDPMPVRITATRVPPVWVTYGTETIVRVRMDGSEEELEIDALTDAPMDGTQLIRLSLDSDILNLCDLIDIPGISDPNVTHETWLGLLEEVDCVIWCTHATQAWRQSEAALWEEASFGAKKPSFLVVTQFDKLKTDRDRTRVLARLSAETEGVFDAILPIATLDAINAGVDEAAWVKSGGAALIEQLVSVLVAASPPPMSHDSLAVTDTNMPAKDDVSQVAHPEPLHLVPERSPTTEPGTCAAFADPGHSRVVPRRVRPKLANPERRADTQKHQVILDSSASDTKD